MPRLDLTQLPSPSPAEAETTRDALLARLEAAEVERDMIRRVLDSTAEAIFRTDVNGTCTFVNRACLATLGYSDPRELLGANIHSVIHHTRPDGSPLDTHQCRIARAIGLGETVHADDEVFWRKDGSSFPAEYWSHPIDEDGRTLGAVVSFLDISERKRTEEVLRRNHETFFNLVQNSPFGVYVVDAGFRLRQVSAGSQKVFQNVRPLIGRDFAEVLRAVWSEPFATQVIELFRHTLRTGEPFHAPNTTERRTDIDHPESYDWKIERITLPDGEFGVVCHFYDLTERQRAAAALATERGRLATVIENMPVGIAICDASGRALSANRAALALHGLTSEDELFRRVADYAERFELHYPSGRVMPQEEWPIHRAIRGEFVRGYEARLRSRHSGLERIVAYSVVPLRDNAGAVDLLVLVMQDLTEDRLTERALRDAMQAAEAANHAKAEFLASMSHELRTPLNAIGGYVELMDMEIHGPLTDMQKQALSRVTANQRHLLMLINDILSFARLEAGRMEFDLRPLSARDMLASVEALVSPQAVAKGVAYTVEWSEPDVRFRGDAERVRQILLNLVGNAIKFTPSGGWVALSSQADDSWAYMRVRDNGVGISTDEQGRIFDPFQQVGRRLNHPQEGVGLGLAISRDLARAMGGELTVASEPGAGSTFVLRLPL